MLGETKNPTVDFRLYLTSDQGETQVPYGLRSFDIKRKGFFAISLLFRINKSILEDFVEDKKDLPKDVS